ncbi:thiamine diphosphokinase [Thetidibacter halocola]|uniref:Thiamine diphosphokinase n=1 Tax=Thetidibacter halocola TaxID=2827239 RepID=A0A8J7W988_9RHOB|nr:thiamine diphosphokinase [Thetidibacter halocola]MBS0123215.1 thiamine diphosphokinase [Thetidibacter halocola]
MKPAIVRKSTPVLLVGGGDCPEDALNAALTEGLPAVAADGGAARLLSRGLVPEAVIGDMDSLATAALDGLPPGVVHRIEEQDSTDFDKCLRNIEAPLILGYGFLGARLDHQLAALTVLAGRPERRCILVGREDVVMLCPPSLHLAIEPGSRLSLWPLGPVGGRSEGLRWPIDGIRFAPGGRVGTSNAVSGPVLLEMDAALMALILPVTALDELRAALKDAPEGWPARS